VGLTSVLVGFLADVTRRDDVLVLIRQLGDLLAIGWRWAE
jgi:hypothetical protein